MVIQIKNFKLYQSEWGGFDLYKTVQYQKIGDGTKETPTGEMSEREDNYGYNMPLETCVNRIVHLIQCESSEVITLRQYVESYKKIKEEVLNILK